MTGLIEFDDGLTQGEAAVIDWHLVHGADVTSLWDCEALPNPEHGARARDEEELGACVRIAVNAEITRLREQLPTVQAKRDATFT